MTTSQPAETVIVRSPAVELDLSVVPQLRDCLTGAHRQGRRVVLDLQDVTFADSSALAVLVAADRRLASTGGSLRLAHVPARIGRVLRICGLGALVLPSRDVQHAPQPRTAGPGS